MNNNKAQIKTKLSKSLQIKINYIYNTLIKLGCGIVNGISFTKIQQMNLYFQPTDSRLELIQWLIATIYPGYKLDSQYINSYDDDPHLMKIKKYSIILWQIGVMPISKFTKNLDYNKYVQGLLGYQSAVNLIYDLTQLAQQKFSSNIKKIQQNATQLLGDLIRYHIQLVNVNYDPYGVTFPAKYGNSEEHEQMIDEQYSLIVEQVMKYKSSYQQEEQIKKQQSVQQCGKLLGEAQDYKQLLSRKYLKLKDQINNINKKYEKIIPESTDLQQITSLHESRVLNISKSLCKNYRKYKNITLNVRQQLFIHNIKDLRNQVISTINSINEITNVLQ